ncbi:hypothetical protein BgiMline_004167 [Biomphalaria glabrata]|nr:hypothetical protein BgiMline_030410 [Biomphalaria glabrata]
MVQLHYQKQRLALAEQTMAQHGLIQRFRQSWTILKKQKRDGGFQFVLGNQQSWQNNLRPFYPIDSSHYSNSMYRYSPFTKATSPVNWDADSTDSDQSPSSLSSRSAEQLESNSEQQ